VIIVFDLIFTTYSNNILYLILAYAFWFLSICSTAFIYSCILFTMFSTTCVHCTPVIFNMFDLDGDGAISKKEFKKVALGFIIGNQDSLWSLDESMGGSETTLDISYFEPLSNLMVDAYFDSCDMKKEVKLLSYEDWLAFAESDEQIQAFLQAMCDARESLLAFLCGNSSR
jgi:hypothetical protein